METQIKVYQSLNKLATTGGLVILGGEEDRQIPLCELKQTFDLQYDFYNRSICELSVTNAASYYDKCVAELAPEEIYLHIGAEDVALFSEDAGLFDRKYRELVQHIRCADKKCDLAIISLKNPDSNPIITEINKHLAAIAQSERCAFCDITKIRVWDPQQTKEIISFVYAMGFVKPLKKKRPLQDLAKILFCYEPV